MKILILSSKIKLFPNPSANFLTVSNLKNKYNFIIVNKLGQKIQKGSISNNEEIDIRNLRNGLYFLKFEDGNTIKFIKE